MDVGSGVERGQYGFDESLVIKNIEFELALHGTSQVRAIIAPLSYHPGVTMAMIQNISDTINPRHSTNCDSRLLRTTCSDRETSAKMNSFEAAAVRFCLSGKIHPRCLPSFVIRTHCAVVPVVGCLVNTI